MIRTTLLRDLVVLAAWASYKKVSCLEGNAKAASLKAIRFTPIP